MASNGTPVSGLCSAWILANDNFAYNLIKIHRTLRVSPAMAAGVTTRLFDVMDLVNLLIESESEKAA